MNDKILNNLVTGFLVFAMFVYVFPAVASAAVDRSKARISSNAQEQDPYTEYPGEIGDIARQAETEVKEANAEYEREKENLEAVKREQYFEDFKEDTSKNLLSKDDIAGLEAKRAQEEKAIRSKAGNAIDSIEAEQRFQQRIAPAGPAPRNVPRTPIRGTVKGIVFFEGKGVALVGGDLVREGDSVLGVKIVKISPDFVLFDKQDKQWKQVVGQMPPAGVWEPLQEQKSAPAEPSTDTKSKNKRGR